MRGVETLIVFDRSISFGMGGAVYTELRSALYDEEEKPKVVSIIGGLGGRDVSVKDFEYMIDRGREVAERGAGKMLETVGIRGEMAGIKG